MKQKIKQAIDELQEFLECDLYTKFRREETIDGQKFNRLDYFKNEKQFQEYLKECFDVLRKKIEELGK